MDLDSVDPSRIYIVLLLRQVLRQYIWKFGICILDMEIIHFVLHYGG